jgi:hypothetical protein
MTRSETGAAWPIAEAAADAVPARPMIGRLGRWLAATCRPATDGDVVRWVVWEAWSVAIPVAIMPDAIRAPTLSPTPPAEATPAVAATSGAAWVLERAPANHRVSG